MGRDCSRIVSFGNILVHGYARVNDHIVWGAAQGSLPALRVDVTGLLAEGPDA